MAKNNLNIPTKGLIGYFSTTLWEQDPDSLRGFRYYRIKYLQILVLVIRNFWADQCLLHASALAFTTILSLVPFLALTFAVLKGLGVPNKLEPLLLQQVAAGSHEIVNRIVVYINNTNMTSLGAIGLVALVVTVITLLGNIEEAFNVIWGVRETRSLYRKFSDYLSVAVSGPLLLFAATSITTTLHSQGVVQWIITKTYLGDLVLLGFSLIPYLSIWVALIFLYIFIPNTQVRLKSAIIGGVLAGTTWQFAQWGYIHFQVGVAKYNAIYGTLALLPIFMVWLYASWLIVLLGLEVVCAHQNIRTFRSELRANVSYAAKEMLVLSILYEVAQAFQNDLPPLTAEQLAEELGSPPRVIRELLELLLDADHLAATAGDKSAYLPAHAMEHILIMDVLTTLRMHGASHLSGNLPGGKLAVQGITSKIENSTASALAGMTMRDLLETSPLRCTAASSEDANH